jgi:cobalt/nickel transport system permease protein
VKRSLHTKVVPRLALFAAFSFVLMMFNIPLPGGSSGHATGVGLAAIILGPAAGMLAISTALLIQALFFGDGGITAFGANAFNMAIVGCLVAWAVYRALTFGRTAPSTRRIAAAAVASYVAINVSALLTAVEFGIQPLLFKDASGNPLYAPFPLSVSIPGMMLGHLTVAGIAEALVTGGVIAYLQRSSPALLDSEGSNGVGWSRTKAAFAMLGLLVLLSPLGLLSAGAAWGERPRVQAVWKAPIANYSPAWFKNPYAGYLFSAITGVFVLVATIVGAGAVLTRRNSG